MILCENNLFLLKNDNLSYMLRADHRGVVRHVHFGESVRFEDAEALACRPGLGWGSNVVLDDRDSGSSLSDIALEWSGSGRGDYRETPLEMDGRPTDFRYVSYEVVEGAAPVASTLPQAHGDCETLILTLEQPGLRLKLYYSLFPTALTRRAVLENIGDESRTIHKIMSFCMDIPGNFEMTSFGGGWSAEMNKTVANVGYGRVVNESVTGASSSRNNPGFLLSEPEATENYGHVYGFNLVYSGNHYSSAQNCIQGLTRVMQGISPSNFSYELLPGTSFETPEAVMSFSDRGFSRLSQRMHRFVNDHIIPEYWRERPRPVLYNSWEGCMFNFTQRRLLDLADRAKDLGCELFVLDDGWFGKRNDDFAGLGDYNINYKKLPDGISGLAKKVQAKGLQFGLWFEPESVNPDSDLYRAHPDWALTDEFPVLLGRHQMLLDLRKKEVRDYIVEQVGNVLDSGPISYVKWDMNRNSIALGADAHEFVLGVYDVLDRIFTPRPGILLEGCSSGGNRFDLGMLCYSPQIWCSDDTDPIQRLTIQGNLSYLYPQSSFGAHVSASPHAQTLRATPLSTRGNVSFFGQLGYELDLKHLLPVEIKEIKAQTAFYKKYREVFQYGDFTRTKTGWQVSRGKTTIAGVFHTIVHAAPPYEQLRVPGLKKDQLYHVTSLEQSLRVGQFGNLLKHVVPVEVNPHGFLLGKIDNHYQMPDGNEDLVASGAALSGGILLKPLFRGTGYDTNQRTQTDFGSNVYVIEEM